MKYLITLLIAALSLNAFGQEQISFLYDGNNSGNVDLGDLLGLLSEYGLTDSDFDGLLDENDLCSDLTSCNYSDPGATDCLYTDECGLCGGDGATIQVFLGIQPIMDSIYVEDIGQWLTYEIGIDSLFSYECPPVQDCTQHSFVNYQGQNYDVVVIGSQCWFAENAKYLPFVNSSGQVSTSSPHCYVYGYNGSDTSEARLHPSFNEIGVHYNWPALSSLPICPSGWMVPTLNDYNQLLSHVSSSIQEVVQLLLAEEGINIAIAAGFDQIDGYLLRSENYGGIDYYGFRSVPTIRLGNSGQWLGNYDELGSSSQYYNNTYRLRFQGSNAYIHDDGNEADAFGTRCVKSVSQ